MFSRNSCNSDLATQNKDRFRDDKDINNYYSPASSMLLSPTTTNLLLENRSYTAVNISLEESTTEKVGTLINKKIALLDRVLSNA